MRLEEAVKLLLRPNEDINMGMNTTPQLWNESTEKYDQRLKGTNGAAHISLNGVVTAVSGVMKSYPLDAINTALTDSATNTTSFIEHAGLKGFSVENLDAIGAGEALIVAWSTVANDSASVASRLNSFATAVGTPDAAGYSNVIAISNGTKIVPEIFWDGMTSIKTIGVRIVGAAGIDVVVRAVEV